MFPRLPSVYKSLGIFVVVCVFCFVFIIEHISKSGSIRNARASNADLLGEYSKTWNTLAQYHAFTQSKDLANPLNFSFIINPVDKCTNENVFLIIYIHSAPVNFRRRQMLRQTWCDPNILRTYKAKVVFVLGSVPDVKVMNRIKMESNEYHDIVQQDFLDSYRNLTYKGIGALRWVSEYCNASKYVLKTDDDIMVNIFQLNKMFSGRIEKDFGKRDLILCNQWMRMKVLRDIKSKWYIPKSDFEPDYFPPYCSGSAFILSIDAAIKMYHGAQHVPFFWVDDYYITGMLAKQAGLKQKRLNDAYILNGRIAVDRFKNDTNNLLLFYHVPKQNYIYKMWTLLKSRMHIPNDAFTWKPTVPTS